MRISAGGHHQFVSKPFGEFEIGRQDLGDRLGPWNSTIDELQAQLRFVSEPVPVAGNALVIGGQGDLIISIIKI